jgi:aminomethyltransferase
VGGVACGHTTSGTFSPTLRTGIALARLDTGVSPGDTVEIEVRGRPLSAEVVKPPFVPSHVRGQ